MATQPEPTLMEFVRYNQWANQQLLAICLNVDEALLTANVPGAYGSIFETFSHILRAEASFLKRIHGRAPEPAFNWEDGPGLAQMAVYEAALGEAFMDTIARVEPTQTVHEEGDGWRFDYQARLLFMSLVYHGISHRTDIMTALNGNGIKLPELDIWGYQFANPERFQASLKKE